MVKEDCLLGFKNIKAEIAYSKYLEVSDFTVKLGENWAILGKNASGKSCLGQLMSENFDIKSGVIVNHLKNKAPYVSFENLSKIIENEIKNDDSEYLGYIDPGQSAYDYIVKDIANLSDFENIINKLNIEHILDTGIKYLSTGEMRKVLICRALLSTKELIILDEPFDGLDVKSKKAMKELLVQIMNDGLQLVLILNRPDEILDSISHVAFMEDCKLIKYGSKLDVLNSSVFQKQKLNFDNIIPGYIHNEDKNIENIELIKMRNVNVSYYEKKILNNINWSVKKGEHWKIIGPNGSGKTTLLSLVNADNPKAYGNDITVMGIKKGTGESIWDIKEKIGLVSSSLQLSYRVPISAFQVIISGFFDSIGVYRHYNESQKDISYQWLDILNLKDKADLNFRNLSYGEQRLLLIARAMVKHPDLLILDEPCQGLDFINVDLILSLIEFIASKSDTTVLYVSHHNEDVIPSIKNNLELIKAEYGYTAQKF